MKRSKFLKALKSRTMWFSMLLMMFGFASDNISQLKGLISPEYYGVTVFGIGMVVAWLRWITTTNLEDK
jgi:hypothetical protein